MYNREYFFYNYRNYFGGLEPITELKGLVFHYQNLTTKHNSAMNKLYMLATVKHETEYISEPDRERR